MNGRTYEYGRALKLKHNRWIVRAQRRRDYEPSRVLVWQYRARMWQALGWWQPISMN